MHPLYFYISSDSGSEITQYIQPQIQLSYDKNYIVSVINASVYNTVPNLYTGQNDQLVFISNGIQRTITFPQGLYSIDSMNTYINQYLVNNSLSATLFVLTGDSATQRSVIRINDATTSILFGLSSVRTLLGFNAITIGPPVPTGQYFYSNSIAKFNPLTDILVHCNISSSVYNNLGVNSYRTDLLCQIPLTAPIGSQIIYQPINPIKTICSSDMISKVVISYTDQDNNSIIINEPTSILIKIEEES